MGVLQFDTPYHFLLMVCRYYHALLQCTWPPVTLGSRSALTLGEVKFG